MNGKITNIINVIEREIWRDSDVSKSFTNILTIAGKGDRLKYRKMAVQEPSIQQYLMEDSKNSTLICKRIRIIKAVDTKWVIINGALFKIKERRIGWNSFSDDQKLLKLQIP